MNKILMHLTNKDFYDLSIVAGVLLKTVYRFNNNVKKLVNFEKDVDTLLMGECSIYISEGKLSLEIALGGAGICVGPTIIATIDEDTVTYNSSFLHQHFISEFCELVDLTINKLAENRHLSKISNLNKCLYVLSKNKFALSDHFDDWSEVLITNQILSAFEKYKKILMIASAREYDENSVFFTDLPKDMFNVICEIIMLE